ncbi:hypothetical protein VM1G_05647 [Cytospora mali]|uniref:Amidase domain-containing protein n=1 Tax=Cytospora mali TaxID=578113 RepID=A0A194VZL7_CYTMA|nr:hypothetical protein VM1G_05647 [Valsa mali]
MARDPHDLASLSNILSGKADAEHEEPPPTEGENPTRYLWDGLSIGVLDSEWGTDPGSSWKWASAEVKDRYASVVKKMETLGARVVFPLENPPNPDILMYEGETVHSISYYEFAGVFQDFISRNFEHNPKLTNLADLIVWNEDHAAQAMPEPYTTQTELVKCLDSTMTPGKHDAATATLRRIARHDGIAKIMHDRNLDIVLSASDASLVSFSSCAGWPIATVPVENLNINGQPWGMFALARDGSTELLLKFMVAFHGCFEGVRGPKGPFE